MTSLILLPVTAAFLGWCINRIAVEVFLGRLFPGGPGETRPSDFQKALAARVGATIQKELLSSGDLEKQVANPDNLAGIMPEIEGHIDQFLRVRLPQAMPVVGMFVGDKTITQLKAVFLEELASLFPIIMTSYLQQLQKNIDPAGMILQKLTAYSGSSLKQAVRKSCRAEIRMVAWLGAISGFVIGLVQVCLWKFFEA